MLHAAAEARKCWACGCLHHALDTIEQAPAVTGLNAAVDAALAAAREHLVPQRYECLGCDVCFPAVALNDLAAGGALDLTAVTSCPTDAVEERRGWHHCRGPIAFCGIERPWRSARSTTMN
jgi:tetrahydromethanopterin S-methyltransferase subunit A